MRTTTHTTAKGTRADHMIPRLRPGWASVVCLAPMCTKRARTKVGACLTPGHRVWVERTQTHAALDVCDRERFGDHCGICAQVKEDLGE